MEWRERVVERQFRHLVRLNMTSAAAPGQRRCEVGTIAMIVRGQQKNIGALVVVVAGHGFASIEEFGTGPRMCWAVESLGGELEVHGATVWSRVVADDALQPMGTMPIGEIGAVFEQHTEALRCKTKAGMERLIQTHFASPDDVGLVGAKRQLRERLQWLTATVTTRQVLLDAGFVPDGNGGECLNYTFPDQLGRRCLLSACPDLVGDLRLFGSCHTVRTATQVNALLRAEMIRGAVYVRLASIWREVFDKTVPLPVEWAPATAYGAVNRTTVLANPGMPKVVLDAQFFRLILNRLRHNFGVDSTDRVVISMVPGQLEFRVGREAFHCPARGSWPLPSSVSLADLLAVVPARIPRLLRIEASGNSVSLCSTVIPAVWP